LISILICLALAILTVITFRPLKDSDFINFDDDVYVYENAYVQSGLNWNSIRRTFSSELEDKSVFWHPVTWLSLMLDYQIFGLNPHGFHLINLLFHVINTVLLFLIFHRMTKTLWQSAFVAALFAIHPLHVESAAWITERKDILSTFFWMLTMGAYGYYVESPGFRRYFLILLFFVLGLMAKPMLVTLPFVLLLMDYWPLRRLKRAAKGSVEAQKQVNPEYKWTLIYPPLLEKVPLFALAILSSIVTYIAVKKAGTIQSIEAIPLSVRIGNAFVSYITYISKMIWPSNLALFYPHPGLLPSWQVLGSASLIIAITLAAIWMARRFPYLAVGWFWYTGTLIPVIGLVQNGSQARADRYTYIPLIGLFIMVAWGFPELLKQWRYRKEALVTLSALSILCFCIITWTQVGYWQDTKTIMEHTLAVTRNNFAAHLSLGHYLMQQSSYEEAITHYCEASRIDPKNPEPYNSIGTIMFKSGRYDDALRYYKKSIKIQPNYLAYYNLGSLFGTMKRNDEAIQAYQKALEIKPDGVEAHADLGWDLYYQGRMAEAEKHLKIALQKNPQLAEHQVILAFILIRQKEFDKASQHLRLAVQYKPDLYQAHYILGQIAMAQGDYNQAIKHYQDAINIRPDFERARNELADILEHQKKTP